MAQVSLKSIVLPTASTRISEAKPHLLLAGRPVGPLLLVVFRADTDTLCYLKRKPFSI